MSQPIKTSENSRGTSEITLLTGQHGHRVLMFCARYSESSIREHRATDAAARRDQRPQIRVSIVNGQDWVFVSAYCSRKTSLSHPARDQEC